MEVHGTTSPDGALCYFYSFTNPTGTSVVSLKEIEQSESEADIYSSFLKPGCTMMLNPERTWMNEKKLCVN